MVNHKEILRLKNLGLTVQYNYHISVEHMNYFVPYEYIKQQVDVRLTQTTVDIFFSSARIVSHLRLHGRPNQCSTVEKHMPPDHQAYLQWNSERLDCRFSCRYASYFSYIGIGPKILDITLSINI